MSQINEISLSNGATKATFNNRVGISGLYINGEQKLFQNYGIWPDINRKPHYPLIFPDPTLFPITGSLAPAKKILPRQYFDGQKYICADGDYYPEQPVYYYKGQIYSMPQHGFIRDNFMKLIDVGNYSCTYEFTSNEKTKKMYPFDFSYQLTYEVLENGMIKKHRVNNTGDDTMYFGLGEHTALALDYPINQYSLSFDNKMFFNLEDKEILSCEGLLHLGLLENNKTISVPNNEAKRCTLYGPDNSEVYYDVNAPYLCIWTADKEKFICIEPWMSEPGVLNDISRNVKKGTLIALDPDDMAYESQRGLTFKLK